VRPLVEQALQQNEAVDIYSDVFTTYSGGDENDDPNTNNSNTNPLMKQVCNSNISKMIKVFHSTAGPNKWNVMQYCLVLVIFNKANCTCLTTCIYLDMALTSI
jgi:hypothetical protein